MKKTPIDFLPPKLREKWERCPAFLQDLLNRRTLDPTQKDIRYLVIFNTRSGRRKFRDRQMMLREFLDEHAINYIFRTVDDVADLASYFREGHCHRIIVAGGDGTLRHVVEKLHNLQLDIPVFFFPIGSMNAFGKVMKLPKDPLLVLRKLLHPTPARYDLGLLNDRHVFLIAACFGRAADMAVEAEKYHKNVFGFLSYLFCFLRLLRNLRIKNIGYHPEHEPSQILQAHSVISFVNGAEKAFFRPQNFQTSSQLRTVFLLHRNIAEIADFLHVHFLRKKPSPHIAFHSARQFTLRGEFGAAVHLDGDPLPLKKQDAFDLKILPGAVTMLK